MCHWGQQNRDEQTHILTVVCIEKNQDTAEGAYHPKQAKTGLVGDPGLCHMSFVTFETTPSLMEQAIDLLIRHRAFCQRSKRSGGSGFFGDAAQQAHGCAMRTGAVAHALDSELG